MNLVIGTLAVLSALVLTGTAVSLVALHRAQALLRDLERGRSEAPPAPDADPGQELRNAIEGLAAQVHDLQRAPSAATPDPAVARPGLNLSKRSQAIRLHRRGESAEQIASALQLPRQEVDLLLKVHRLVLSSV